MIGIKGTSTTIIDYSKRGGKCVCDETLKITEDDIKGAGGRGGEHPRPKPFSMVSKHQQLVEASALAFSKKVDARARDEGRFRSIEEGKLADMIVFSEDVTTVEAERIKDIAVLTTIMDGKIVYQRG